MPQILVIEDDRRVSGLLCRGLEEFGYETTAAFDGQMGLRVLNSLSPALVICDVILPGENGFEVVKKIKSSHPDLPVLMLTALGTTDDKLEGFDAGADDYMVKPFDIRELEARVKILLRRNSADNEKQIYRELTYANLTIDLQTNSVSRDGKFIKLTPKEFNLLSFMVRNPDRVLSRVEIAEKVWETHFDTGTNFIDVYINYLRKKIDRDFHPRLIHTVTGSGFIMTVKNEDQD